jgi:hypothetical protein
MSGNGYITIGSVAAKNNGIANNYYFTENNSFSTTTQYRLKLIDKDNRYRYSEVKTVKGIGSPVDFTISPNPSYGSTTIISTDISGSEHFQVLDNLGKVIRSISNNNGTGIYLTGLQKGVYFVRLTNQKTGEQLTKKLVVIQ